MATQWNREWTSQHDKALNYVLNDLPHDIHRAGFADAFALLEQDGQTVKSWYEGLNASEQRQFSSRIGITVQDEGRVEAGTFVADRPELSPQGTRPVKFGGASISRNDLREGVKQVYRDTSVGEEAADTFHDQHRDWERGRRGDALTTGGIALALFAFGVPQLDKLLTGGFQVANGTVTSNAAGGATVGQAAASPAGSGVLFPSAVNPATGAITANPFAVGTPFSLSNAGAGLTAGGSGSGVFSKLAAGAGGAVKLAKNISLSEWISIGGAAAGWYLANEAREDEIAAVEAQIEAQQQGIEAATTGLNEARANRPDFSAQAISDRVASTVTDPNLVGGFRDLFAGDFAQAQQFADSAFRQALPMQDAAFSQGQDFANRAFNQGVGFSEFDFAQAQDFAQRNFERARSNAYQNFADAQQFANRATTQNNQAFNQFLDPRARSARDKQFEIANETNADAAFARARQLRAPATPVGAGGGGSRLDARDFQAAYETEEAQRQLQFQRLGGLVDSERALTSSLQERASSFLQAGASMFTGEGSRFINDTAGSYLSSINSFDRGLGAISTIAGLAPQNLATLISGLATYGTQTEVQFQRDDESFYRDWFRLLTGQPAPTLSGADPNIAGATNTIQTFADAVDTTPSGINPKSLQNERSSGPVNTRINYYQG